jgi:hypothetical protein
VLTVGDSAAETGTPNSDDDDESFQPIEEILSRGLQKRGFGVVGERCSTANADRGDGEEALSGQRGNDICNSVGNTRGELYPVPQRKDPVQASNIE